MRNISLALAAGLVAAVFVGGSARAADDTYVSAAGADAGDCAVAAPCASLRYALRRTAPGGTIVILTSGRYGAIDITKSVHIEAKGVQAVLDGLASCKAVVCVNAGPTDVVSLRGLTINVSAYPNNAIAFSSGASLHIEDCVTNAVAGFGIFFAPSGAATLHVFDSTIAAEGEAIDVSAMGATQHAVLDGDTVRDALHGLVLDGYGGGEIRATVRNSTIGWVGGYGINVAADGGNAVQGQLMLDHVVLTGGQVGIVVGSGQVAVVRVGDSLVTGYSNAGISGTVASYGTNKVVGNEGDGIDGYPLPTIPMK